MSDTEQTSTEAPSKVDHRSPPVPSDNQAPSTTAATTSKDNGANARLEVPVEAHIKAEEGDLDADGNDSEAETVLSSPVKRREALRKANGVKVDTSSGLSTETKAESTSPTSSKKSRSVIATSINGDNDGLSSRLSDNESRGVSGSPELPDGSEPLTNGHGSKNSRKRKHRESSAGQRPSTAESAKRARRASVIDTKESDRSSEELSPPPRLRRHKRATSNQAREEGNDVSISQEGRSRRAGSRLPSREPKAFKNNWDSGSESEVSTKQAQNRNIRGINRSVSTPGRPMGRDHKRHVNKYGFTRLAEACENGDLELVKEWRQKDPEQLEHPEFAGNTPLQVAALNGHAEIIQYLLGEGCNIHCSNSDKDTPLIDAVENEHPEVVKLLLEAGVNPMKQNVKGQQALDLVGTGDCSGGIRALLRTAIEDWKARGAEENDEVLATPSRPGPKQALHFMARTPENLMKLVVNNDREGVIEFLAARVPVNNDIVAAAARTGDLYLVNMLLADMSPRKAGSRPERPMKAALGTSHFDMVKTLTELDQFDPLYRDKATGSTWFELAESRSGPHWEKERDLLLRLHSDAKAKKSRLSSSPVSRRGENGPRRIRSPDLSDEDMDNIDSLDAARTKRRLLSKKVMRANRRSPSTESTRAASSPEITIKPPSNEDVKQARRKPGRPRTMSLSSSHANGTKAKTVEEEASEDVRVSHTDELKRARQKPGSHRAFSLSPQPAEVKAKRVKSRTRENIALFDTAGPTKKRKSEDGRQGKPASESLKRTDDSNNDIDEDAKMVDIKEEENRKAAAERKETERKEIDCKETERKEAEEAARREEAERLEAERKAAEELAAQRSRKLETLPSALRRLLAHDHNDTLQLSSSIARKLLPLQAVSGAALDLEGEGREGAWMLSYQAAGILRGAAADTLLQIPSQLSTTSDLPLSDGPQHPVSPAQRNSMLVALGSANMSSEGAEVVANGDAKATTTAMRALRNSIRLDSAKFLDMKPLTWISVKDFLSAKAELQERHGDLYPHLQHLPALEVAFDACLDDSPFDITVAIKTETPQHAGTPAKSQLPNSPVQVLDSELRRSIGHGLREGDGHCRDASYAATHGMTKVEVVID